MCALATILAFVLAHMVAAGQLGGGWRGAARAPVLVFPPAVALIVLDGVVHDSYALILPRMTTLLTWELLYLFGYVFLRLLSRPLAHTIAAPNIGAADMERARIRTDQTSPTR